ETRLKEIRDAVNAAIQQANKTPNAPKLSGGTINEKNSYIHSTLGNTPASEILKYRANVEEALRKIDKSVLRIEGDKKWYRLIVHGISTTNYVHSMEAMTQLRTEIESYNPLVTLLNNPHWLTRPEKREGKKFSSVSIALDNQDVAILCINKGLRVDMQLLKVEHFVINRVGQQCSTCQAFGHHYARYPKKQPVCRLCEASHKTTDHKCTTCNRHGARCEHLVPFYANCQTTGHTASDNSCVVKKATRFTRPTPKPSQPTPKTPMTSQETTTRQAVEDQEMEGA